MTAAAPNKLQARFCQEFSRQLSRHRVVLLFDPAEQLRSLLDALATSQPSNEAPGGLNLRELQARWVVAGSSLFALRHQLEPQVCADLPDPLLVYLPQRQEADGHATLLELIRAGTVFEAQLVNRARVYLREVMEPDKVERLLKRPDLTYHDIAIALEESGGGGFSQLKGLFRQQLGGLGSPPENAELARLWLASDLFDAGISAKGLQSELQDLLHSRWGLGFPADATLAEWRQRAQRALLLHEFLNDWHGDELTAFAKQSLPVGKAAEENALADVKALRRNHAGAYIAIASRIETELVLPELISGERPGVLGSIDTFPCEEQFLLRSVDMQRELDTIEEAVRRLAALPLEQPLERFVITSDHGFLHLPLGREPAMRIPPPAGKTFKLERRCWLGHPSAVQEPCIEIPPADLGYGSNGLSVVVPRSAGVFKAGGSLCYHHGGTSLQEVLIPLLSFRCSPTGAVAEEAKAAKGKRSKQLAWPGKLPDRITNRILMLPIELPATLLNQGQSRQVLLAAYDSKSGDLVSTPIQAISAELDRATNRLTLTPGQGATMGLMLPAEVSAKKLYLELRDAATDLVLHKSPDLPVDLIS